MLKSVGLKSLFRKKSKLPHKEKMPIEEVGDVIVSNKKYKIVLKVVDPINSDLLGTEDTLNAISSIQGCLNALELGQRVQILISSEKMDMTAYQSYLSDKMDDPATDDFSADRMRAKGEFLWDHSHNSRNIHNFYLVLESKFNKLNEAIDELNDIAAALVEMLDEGGMGAELATPDDIKKVIYTKMNPSLSSEWGYSSDIDLMNLAPTYIRDRGSYYEMDDVFYSFYTFSYFPEEVSPSWLKKVIEAKVDLDLSISLEVADKEKVTRATNAKMQEIEGRLLGKLPPMYKKKYENQLNSLDHLMEEIQNDSENLFDVTFLLGIRANSLDDLKTSEQRLRTAVSSSKLRSRKLSYQGTDVMWYTLPIAHKKDYLEDKICWSMQASIVASILPFNSSELNYNEGVLKGFNAKTGSPITYDRYVQSKFHNPNEVVLGESGSGKSYYLRLDMLRHATSGNSQRLFVIDPEREYFIPTSHRITFSLGSQYTTNPFHIRSTIVDTDDDYDGMKDVGQYLRRKIGEMMSFFHWIVPDMTPLERANLLQAIQIVYDKRGLNFSSSYLPAIFPTLSDLVACLRNHFPKMMDNFIAALYPYVEGAYKDMFNGQTNWSMANKISIFDIHELGDEVKRPLMDLLLKDIWEEMKIDRKEKKGLYVDEAWLLADEKNQQTMEFLREIAKRIRKYGGFLTTATQNVDDFLTIGKYGTAIFNNAYIKTFMRMSERDIHELGRFMTFSDKELKILGKGKKRGYCIHLAGTKRVEMRTKSSPDEENVLGLNKKSVQRIDGNTETDRVLQLVKGARL